jgi:putative DNA primase/helicase
MIEIADQCRNRWPSILPMFGIGVEFLSGKHGPCPICEGTDRFRFDDKDGRGTFFCTHCRPGDGLKLLMLKTGQTFEEVARSIRERLGETSESPSPRSTDPERARQASGGLWSGAVPIHSDQAAHYLTSRGIPGPYPSALRFCAAAWETDTRRRLPAMLALVTAPDGSPANVHRTFLENGRKAQIPAPRKMMLGDVAEGSAIRLGTHDGVLGVAEGIETALTVTRLFGITCWSAVDEGKLAKFAIPADVRELHVFGDNDLNFVGQAAAYTLAKRASLMRDGPAVVTVRIPDQPGADWADTTNLRSAV